MHLEYSSEASTFDAVFGGVGAQKKFQKDTQRLLVFSWSWNKNSNLKAFETHWNITPKHPTTPHHLNTQHGDVWTEETKKKLRIKLYSSRVHASRDETGMHSAFAIHGVEQEAQRAAEMRKSCLQRKGKVFNPAKLDVKSRCAGGAGIVAPDTNVWLAS